MIPLSPKDSRRPPPPLAVQAPPGLLAGASASPSDAPAGEASAAGKISQKEVVVPMAAGLMD